MADDVTRLDDRVAKLQRHFEQSVDDVHASAGRRDTPDAIEEQLESRIGLAIDRVTEPGHAPSFGAVSGAAAVWRASLVHCRVRILGWAAVR